MNRFTAFKTAFSILFFLVLAVSADAQTAQNTPAKTPEQIAADEFFTLNIVEERINEIVYERSTVVQIAANESRVELQVGATVRAQKISINLRGITGNIRFRASLEKIRRLIR